MPIKILLAMAVIAGMVYCFKLIFTPSKKEKFDAALEKASKTEIPYVALAEAAALKDHKKL